MPSSARSLNERHPELADEGIRAPFLGFMNCPWNGFDRPRMKLPSDALVI